MRFFVQFMLFFGAISTFTVGTNIAIGLDFAFNYKWIAIAVLAFGLVAATRMGYQSRHLMRTGIYGTCFGVFPIAWLSSAGLASPAITYAALLLVLVNYLLTGRERLVVNGLFIGEVLVLISLFHLQPSLFATLSPTEQLADWLINVPIVFAFLAYLLTQFERAYETKRRENETKARELEALSVTDPLTGLYNRLAFDRRLDDALAHYHRSNDPVTLLFLDVDEFKAYNDHYGHGQGDICLVEVAHHMRGALLRDTDTAFRIGGEEFVIILEGADAAGATQVAERLRTRLAEAAIPHAASSVATRVTLSMGIATTDPATATPGKLLAAADAALYQAKATGRNQILIATPDITQPRPGQIAPGPAMG